VFVPVSQSSSRHAWASVLCCSPGGIAAISGSIPARSSALTSVGPYRSMTVLSVTIATFAPPISSVSRSAVSASDVVTWIVYASSREARPSTGWGSLDSPIESTVLTRWRLRSSTDTPWSVRASGGAGHPSIG
jgi:hypothetical protein